MIEINKNYNENCLDTMSKMEDNFIDLVVTSPPYDNLRDYDGFGFDFENIAKGLHRVTKEGGVVVWIVGDSTVNGSETGNSFKQALYFKEIGFNLHDTMIYQKSGLSYPDINRYYQCFEYMFILSKGKIKNYNLIKDKLNVNVGKKVTGGSRQINGEMTVRSGGEKNRGIKKYGIRTNIWGYATGFGHSYKEDYLKKHPAIFPEKLANDHILSWSNINDLIYDPFMGSGTTAKCCKLLGRNWVGSEISQEYCDLTEKRTAFNMLF